MTTIGWHQDQQDATISRYWDGERWQGTLVWNGTDWVAGDDQPAAPAAAGTDVISGAMSAASRAVVPAVAAGVARLGRARTVILVGAAAAAVSVLLPWHVTSSVAGSEHVGPSAAAGSAFLLLAIVGGVAALAWPRAASEQPLAVRRLIGIAALTAVMGLFVVAKFNAIGDAAQKASQPTVASQVMDDYGVSADLSGSFANLAKVEVQPGSGLYLWTIGTVAIAAGLGDALRSRKAQDDGAVEPTTF